MYTQIPIYCSQTKGKGKRIKVEKIGDTYATVVEEMDKKREGKIRQEREREETERRQTRERKGRDREKRQTRERKGRDRKEREREETERRDRQEKMNLRENVIFSTQYW